MPKLLILVGHPNPQSLTAALADAYRRAAQGLGADVTAIELATLRFDPVLRHGYQAEQALEPDLVRAREAIVAADHVAWFFPMWWGSPPAIVKGFLERVFLPGFAFRYRSRLQTPEKLLSGRSARFVTSMDSPNLVYALVMRRSMHAAFATGTLSFAGFAPVHNTTFYEARFMDEAARSKALVKMERNAESDVRMLTKQASRPRLSRPALALSGAAHVAPQDEPRTPSAGS